MYLLELQIGFVVLQDGFTPLLLALREKRVDVAEFLIDKGADINVVDDMQR